MIQTCPKCPRGCRPTATNAIGVSIEEHRGAAGWVAVGTVYKTYCEAGDALEQIQKDNVDRRIYAAFPKPQPVPQEPVNIWSIYNAFIASCFGVRA